MKVKELIDLIEDSEMDSHRVHLYVKIDGKWQKHNALDGEIQDKFSNYKVEEISTYDMYDGQYDCYKHYFEIYAEQDEFKNQEDIRKYYVFLQGHKRVM